MIVLFPPPVRLISHYYNFVSEGEAVLFNGCFKNEWGCLAY
jgi:hypothetical protein